MDIWKELFLLVKQMKAIVDRMTPEQQKLFAEALGDNAEVWLPDDHSYPGHLDVFNCLQQSIETASNRELEEPD